MKIPSPRTIILLGVAVRVVLLVVGIWLDQNTSVGFTDLDYKVFTDGARYVLQGESPYQRHTYRYTPILAYIMTLNHTFVEYFGKVLFVVLDVVAGLLISSMNTGGSSETKAISMMIWFFNPLSVHLSTRGSSDIIISVLLLATLFLLKRGQLVLSAIFYGFTVHFKIYPIIYCLAIYLYLALPDRKFFNARSITFGLIAGGVFLGFKALFYNIYGMEFLWEGYLYHAVRKDHRHNFSIQFMFIYLFFNDIDSISSALLFIPPILLIALISLRYYRELDLCLFLTTLVFVAFNKVVTAQYFLWYIQFLPLIFDKVYGSLSKSQRRMNWLLYAVWLCLILIWNNLAHRFEAQGQDMFILFHMVNCLFFLMNVMICFATIKGFEITKHQRALTAVHNKN
jgi:phosphatidylinositol glycan class M